MKRALTFCALAAVLASAAPRRAHACGSAGGGYGSIIAVGLLLSTAVVVGDLGFVISDASKAARTEVPSAGHGVGELLLALPQVALSGAALAASLSSSTQYRSNQGAIALSGVWLALSAGMGAHAIWTLGSQGRVNERATMPSATRRSVPADTLAAAPRPPPLRAQLVVAPTLLEAGAQRGPGLAALVRF